MFKGSIVALASPFRRGGPVDPDALARLIDWHVAEGTAALVVAGTTGESATLDTAEHVDLIALASEQAAGRIPVIAGTGSNSTAQTIALSRAVDKLDVAAFLLVAPYYNKPSQEGLYQHFAAIADELTRPVILYNVPGRTVADIQPETVARLAAHPRIIGIKDATGDIERLRATQPLTPPDFLQLSGDDFTTGEFIAAGGHGCISVTANIAPGWMSNYCDAALAGDTARVGELDQRLQSLHRAMFMESNPIPVKWALEKMGWLDGSMRLPLTELDTALQGGVLAALKEAGLV